MNDSVDAYLRSRKRADRDRWPLVTPPTDGIDQVVVIPALAECETLFDTLEDLEANPAQAVRRTLVICVVNNRQAPHATPEDIKDNQHTLARLDAMVRNPAALGGLRLAYVDASSPGRELPEKEGVGLARKIGLDWGLALLHEEAPANRSLVSLDADTRLDADYLPALHAFFETRERWAAVLDYAHPLDGGDAAAILSYELLLRYHELGLAYARSPYAYPAIGSAMACTARAYAAVSGMNRRRAGEDFYFLQQLAKTGPVERITGATVRPSPRSSLRVPFGTGARVRRFHAEPEEAYRAYHPKTYRILKAWLEVVAKNLPDPPAELLGKAEAIEPALAAYLRAQRFETVWARLQANASNPRTLHRQFHTWFDGLRTLRLIHHLRDHDYPQQDLFESIAALMRSAAREPRPAQDTPHYPLPTTHYPLSTIQDASLRHDLDGQRRLLEHLRAACRRLGTAGVPSCQSFSEAEGGQCQHGDSHSHEHGAVLPKIEKAGVAQDDAAEDADEIGGGQALADEVDDRGHGFLGEDEAGEQHGGHYDHKCELQTLNHVVGQGRDKQAKAQRGEEKEEGEDGKQQQASGNRDLEQEAHQEKDRHCLHDADE